MAETTEHLFARVLRLGSPGLAAADLIGLMTSPNDPDYPEAAGRLMRDLTRHYNRLLDQRVVEAREREFLQAFQTFHSRLLE
jgi:hypothetical protein